MPVLSVKPAAGTSRTVGGTYDDGNTRAETEHSAHHSGRTGVFHGIDILAGVRHADAAVSDRFRAELFAVQYRHDHGQYPGARTAAVYGNSVRPLSHEVAEETRPPHSVYRVRVGAGRRDVHALEPRAQPAQFCADDHDDGVCARLYVPVPHAGRGAHAGRHAQADTQPGQCRHQHHGPCGRPHLSHTQHVSARRRRQLDSVFHRRTADDRLVRGHGYQGGREQNGGGKGRTAPPPGHRRGRKRRGEREDFHPRGAPFAVARPARQSVHDIDFGVFVVYGLQQPDHALFRFLAADSRHGFRAAAYGRAGFRRMHVRAVGAGWATINVHSFVMSVELATEQTTGAYTGLYYAFAMGAQATTPFFAGLCMDYIDPRALLPYALIFAALAFFTMLFVRHGNVRPAAGAGGETGMQQPDSAAGNPAEAEPSAAE